MIYPTSSWHRITADNVFSIHLYDMIYWNCDLSETVGAIASAGGMVALSRNTQLLLAERGPDLVIYDQSGQKYSEVTFGDRYILAMGWTESEHLILVFQDGSVCVLSPRGQIIKQFVSPCADSPVAIAAVSGSSLAILAGSSLFVINDAEIANTTYTTWALNESVISETGGVTSAAIGISGALTVYLGCANGNVISVYEGGYIVSSVFDGMPISRMAVSSDHGKIALWSQIVTNQIECNSYRCSQSGQADSRGSPDVMRPLGQLICYSSDLQLQLGELASYDLDVLAMAWSASDAVVVVNSYVEEAPYSLWLLVPDGVGELIESFYMKPVITTEVDGCRVVERFSSLLYRVSNMTVATLGGGVVEDVVASAAGKALTGDYSALVLLDSTELKRAFEAMREVICSELDPLWQARLLTAFAHAHKVCTCRPSVETGDPFSVSAELASPDYSFCSLAARLRAVNALSAQLYMPMTLKQFEALGTKRIATRLVTREYISGALSVFSAINSVEGHNEVILQVVLSLLQSNKPDNQVVSCLRPFSRFIDIDIAQRLFSLIISDTSLVIKRSKILPEFAALIPGFSVKSLFDDDSIEQTTVISLGDTVTSSDAILTYITDVRWQIEDTDEWISTLQDSWSVDDSMLQLAQLGDCSDMSLLDVLAEKSQSEWAKQAVEAYKKAGESFYLSYQSENYSSYMDKCRLCMETTDMEEEIEILSAQGTLMELSEEYLQRADATPLELIRAIYSQGRIPPDELLSQATKRGRVCAQALGYIDGELSEQLSQMGDDMAQFITEEFIRRHLFDQAKAFALRIVDPVWKAIRLYQLGMTDELSCFMAELAVPQRNMVQSSLDEEKRCMKQSCTGVDEPRRGDVK